MVDSRPVFGGLLRPLSLDVVQVGRNEFPFLVDLQQSSALVVLVLPFAVVLGDCVAGGIEDRVFVASLGQAVTVRRIKES